MQFLQVLSLVASASAFVASDPLEKRADIQYNDSFDDLATTIVLPQLFPVGLYNGLSYGGVVVLRPIDGVASVLPHSPPQHGGAAGPLDLLYLGDLTLNTFATLTRGNTVKSFDLQDFYWGFGTDTGTTFGLAQPGTIYVVGYTVSGQELTTTFSYVPDSTFNARLTFAQLPAGWVDLQNVTFAVANSEPISERTYIALDNVRHINHV
ncbi:hypothetical protein M409DRAFT_55294 [Zasmidium cellare ATCC 36951]|uniref:Uncharacterized protein n=1 Tax=Zasmidium cellare ATCC 36951 TaxID=1080233 RepID=A0A6A6CIB7_ZASCE|nr:uncharacterized protein M409DRAFT_55294 [Zasmidium cellare ATCC 36951]KAF2165928.1 hypothetical protein M409DRAFT_55294 [Zasmidium cellare ATCC 36951]